MKQLTKIFLPLAMTLFFVACKKDENRVFYEGGTAPVLTTTANQINLAFANADNEAMTLSWTNPDYRFNTGVSSQDVSYFIEIDVAGANFNGANKQTVAVSRDLSRKFMISEINDYLLNQLLFTPGVQRNIEVRVKSALINGAAALYSNVLEYTVTPYAIPPKVVPPPTGTLYITGAATPASWMTDGDAELLSQKFNQISTTLYELPSITLTGGASYLLVPVYGNWSNKFGGLKGNNENNVNGDDFKAGGSDLLSPPVTGNYKIVVDFQRGKFTLTKL